MISVLTLVKGRALHLAQLVEGLRRSATRPEELIVVAMDDAAIDLGATPFPTRIERLPDGGLPLAAARNRAASLARGQNLLFLDVDCIPARGLLGAMEAALESHDALVCAEALYLGPDDARGKWTEEELAQAGRPHPVRPFPAEGFWAEENAGLFWSLAFGVRRATFAALGGFDEAFVGYGGEDTDFGFRAREAKVPLLLMAGPGAFHQHHAVSDPPLEHFDDILRNAAVFRAKWGVWPMTGWLQAFAGLGLITWSIEADAIAVAPGLAPGVPRAGRGLERDGSPDQAL